MNRIDPIGQNGNTGEHYGTVQIGRFVYRKGPSHYTELREADEIWKNSPTGFRRELMSFRRANG